MKAETTLTVGHAAGLHARPGTLFAKAAAQFQSTITISNLTTGGKTVSAKSIFSILTAGVKCNHEIHLTADGEDAEAAIQELTHLVQTNFGETH